MPITNSHQLWNLNNIRTRVRGWYRFLLNSEYDKLPDTFHSTRARLACSRFCGRWLFVLLPQQLLLLNGCYRCCLLGVRFMTLTHSLCMLGASSAATCGSAAQACSKCVSDMLSKKIHPRSNDILQKLQYVYWRYAIRNDIRSSLQIRAVVSAYQMHIICTGRRNTVRN